MPLLAGLTPVEMEALVHKLQNENTASETLLSEMTSNTLEKELAVLSEEENFKMKNWYRHSQKTLKWADKKRQRVDSYKVRDMLRN